MRRASHKLFSDFEAVLTSANWSDFYFARSKRLFFIIPEMAAVVVVVVEVGGYGEQKEYRGREKLRQAARCCECCLLKNRTAAS